MPILHTVSNRTLQQFLRHISILAFNASNQERMQENKTVSQALFAGAIINVIKQFHQLPPIAGVTFMCRARLSKAGPSFPKHLQWEQGFVKPLNIICTVTSP